MKFHKRVGILLVVVVLSIVGCTNSRVDVQNKLKVENREGKVVPITMPTKPDVIAPQPAPKIGHLLGMGSLAIVRNGQLEVVSPGGTLVARGVLNQEVQLWFVGAPQPWSKSGRLLLYQSGPNILRVMDFEAGEDRLLVGATPGYFISGPYVWINGETELTFQMTARSDSLELWKVARDGTGLRRIDPIFDDGFRFSRISDTSSDGSSLLLTGENANYAVVYVMDLASGNTFRITPLDKHCRGGQFMPNDTDVLVLCKEDMRPDEWEGGRYHRTNVYLTDIQGRKFTLLVEGDEGGWYISGISPDGTKIALNGGRSTHPAAGGPYDNVVPEDRVVLLDLIEGNVTTLVQPSDGVQINPLGFSQDGMNYLVHRFPCVLCRNSRKRLNQPDVDALTSQPQTFNDGNLPSGVLESYSLAQQQKAVLDNGITRAFLSGRWAVK